jgi:hypothetical protein
VAPRRLEAVVIGAAAAERPAVPAAGRISGTSGCAPMRDIEILPPLPPGVRPIAGGSGYEIPAIFAITAILSAGVGAYAQYSSAQQQAAAYEYNAAVQRQQAVYQQQLAEMEAQMLQRQAAGVSTLAEAQAALNEQQAIAAEAAGRVREAAIRRAYERTQSDVHAAIGKAGVDTTGSPLLVLIENADTAGQELALNDYQTALDVAGAKAGAAYARTEGSLRASSLIQEAAYRRFGGAVGATGALSAANLSGFQAGGARMAGAFGVGRSLLSGASEAASPFLRYGYAAPSAPVGAYPRFLP